jgi:putative oxidoreductase
MMMTNAKPNGQANPQKLYIKRTIVFMGIYIIMNAAAIAGILDGTNAIGKYLFALGVSTPIIGQIWAMLMLIRTSDEFVSAILAQQFILAAGLTFAVASLWGFAELYADAPHISAAMVYPLFWAVFGATAHFIKSSRR